MILWNRPGLEITTSLYFEFDAERSQDHVKALWLIPGKIESTPFQIVGVSFYTGEAISILTSSPEGQRLIQLPISHLEPFLSGFRVNDQILTLGDSCLSTQSIMNIAGPVSILT